MDEKELWKIAILIFFSIIFAIGIVAVINKSFTEPEENITHFENIRIDKLYVKEIIKQ